MKLKNHYKIIEKTFIAKNALFLKTYTAFYEEKFYTFISTQLT